jgi:hypothetical protein
MAFDESSVARCHDTSLPCFLHAHFLVQSFCSKVNGHHFRDSETKLFLLKICMMAFHQAGAGAEGAVKGAAAGYSAMMAKLSGRTL